ncbi:MAG: Amino-acid carrier protein AlsT [Chlamydiales bacterium]|nr:Amino-acid carrier protein AlsT [Chlamydiales bacterium]MCH9619673.1 Amino-acid carrier protein AlsT [Chlamydiales bacterium]MCH9623279.1 Amino-acid carrier protein AlsT [Chlamydiales bacterium]
MLDQLLFASGVLMLVVSLILTIKTRFVQFRKLPQMISLFFIRKKAGEETICARRALFTAMSTTLGLSTMVAPVIAIRLGGPGAVVGFFLATVLGAAVSYTEVSFALAYRKKRSGTIAGGPMQYLQDAVSPWMAKWYAFGCGILMMTWSAAQSNQLAQLLSSPNISLFPVPCWVTGSILACSILVILIGGIQRISSWSAKLVPTMFLLYLGGALFIISINMGKLPAIFTQIWSSCFHPTSFGSGIAVGGLLSAFRWGILKGLHGNEAGMGTQTIPHSVAEVDQATDQGILSMASTYCAGLILILSSLVTLITETWLDPTLNLGMDMVAASFFNYFSYIGLILVSICALLFASGTILGNSYNGSQCFLYLSKERGINIYYFLTTVLIFWGAIADVKFLWGNIDFVLVLVLVPHLFSLLWLSFRRQESLTMSF